MRRNGYSYRHLFLVCKGTAGTAGKESRRLDQQGVIRMLKRRSFLWQVAAVLTVGPAIVRAEQAPLVQVYKSRTCSCCSKWVDHMRDAGFEVSSTGSTAGHGVVATDVPGRKVARRGQWDWL